MRKKSKKRGIKNQNVQNETKVDGNETQRDYINNSDELCYLHPEEHLVTSEKLLKELKSSELFSSSGDSNSLLCKECAVKVSVYFEFLQSTLKDVISDLLGLENEKKCVECVKTQLLEKIGSKKVTNPVAREESSPGQMKSSNEVIIEDKIKKDGSSVEHKISSKIPALKNGEGNEILERNNRSSVESLSNHHNINGSHQLTNKSVNLDDHQNCNSTQCHIKRWYCEQSDKTLSPIKLPKKPITVEKDIPPLINKESNITVTRSADNLHNEAFLTMASDDLHAVGSLVLGHSIRLSQTKRCLAIMLHDSVSVSMRKLLQQVFDQIIDVNNHELALLNDPNVGVSFAKIHAWRMTQFTKCVFLDCDTFMLQNCDELFDREEFSAVPDIRWPDCFNNSVFIFTPSTSTYKELFNTAQMNNCIDGGDQSLLNMYFGKRWSTSINCRLPFIYNLMANVSYTYAPAFKQFGHNAKIVHFLGSQKPWNVYWSPLSGKISPASLANIHRAYYSFINAWLIIFIHYVMPTLSSELQKMIKGFYSITVRELIGMYQESSVDTSDFMPGNPSMRYLYKNEEQNVQISLSEKSNITRKLDVVVDKIEDKLVISESRSQNKDENIVERDRNDEENIVERDRNDEENIVEKDRNDEENRVVDGNPNKSDEEQSNDKLLPDYNRMHLWESGKMDYTGSDSSNNIIKKLDALMSKNNF